MAAREELMLEQGRGWLVVVLIAIAWSLAFVLVGMLISISLLLGCGVC